MTPDDVAKELDITPQMVRRHCNEGKLGQKIGRSWIITRDEFEQFKKNRKGQGRPKKQ